MKITLIQIGKTDKAYLNEGINLYIKRIEHYAGFEILTIPDLKQGKLSKEETKTKEGALIIAKTKPESYIVLLDERGKSLSSVEFAGFVENLMLQSVRQLTFIIGGAYGFAEAIYKMADMKLSLSAMTFSHQLVRLIFVEQLYRAFTIIKGEPYHNE